MYSIKEIYKTIQGEGAQSGRTAVFVRFTGCNLWSGKEKHRADAICNFCDTDFVGTDGENGGRYSAEDLVKKIKYVWGSSDHGYIVFTGGEPMLQLDKELVEICKKHNFETAIETNGTIKIDFEIDWICVSPKAGSSLIVSKGNELKVVFPQEEIQLDHLQNLTFDHYFLQPLDSEKGEENTFKTIEYCKKNPRWKLSLQQHKLLGIP
jgi:7-carboxy-7-deazaguanine synthase (Cx14CxxC type)|tara:strand:- start:1124 stop:1747 length:624 start_codon:yes stop_codon:yes gene_type:complete